MTRIKICGITNKIDALNAASLGVDMLGFVFYKKSKRYVEPKSAMDIVNELPPSIGRVGVFVNEGVGKVSEIADECSIDILQFHGEEPPDYCSGFKGRFKVIKAFRVKDKRSLKKINDYDVDFYLLDACIPGSRGGTGKIFDWKILEEFEFLRPLILSGGLTPKNVISAVKEIAPYGVDVSTSLEASFGKKDFDLLKEFVENVRRVG